MNPSLGLSEGRFLASCLVLLSTLVILYARRWHKREQLIRRKLRVWILERLFYSDLDYNVLVQRLPHPRCQLCQRCLGLELEWLWERNYVAPDEHGHSYRLDKLGRFRLRASRPNPTFSQKRRIRFTGHVHPR